MGADSSWQRAKSGLAMNVKSSLQQALDLSDKVLVSIELQQLDDISKLEKQRGIIIDQYYKNNDSIDEDLTLLLKQKNDLIVSQLIELKQKTRSQQIKMNNSQKASKAYLDNT